MKKLVEILERLLVVVVVASLTALLVMCLWNWIMPKIFGLITINFWEALGLFLLSQLLSKSTTLNGSSN